LAERKPQWPENGDLVIASIETVTDYGAYAKLDEFEKRGLLHVSEISSSWIRQKTADNIVAYVHKAGGEGNFRREK
jgi:translation initiation factor 2 alpha subunit (eIF-2alpha)